jgi:hypothetical protein
VRLSRLLTFDHGPVFAIEPPQGFEALAQAMTEQWAITIIYERGLQRVKPRRITPRLVLEGQGIA